MNAFVGINNKINTSVSADHQSRARGLHNAIRLLAKQTVVEIDFVDIPGRENRNYLRRITIHKSPSEGTGLRTESPEADLPNLDDLAQADISWIGLVKAAPYGSRQFRNRHILTASVDVIREIDGYLYLMRCGHRDMPDLEPALVSLRSGTRSFVSFRISTEHDLSADQLAYHFPNPPKVPESLVKELTDLGFIQDGKQFNWTDGQQTMRITVDLYGKMITPM